MSQQSNETDHLEQKIECSRERIQSLHDEIQSVIVGYEREIRELVTALLAGGHVLLEGVPGLGKTLMVRTLSDALDVGFSRVQFTPDLMPADILGTEVFVDEEDGSSFRFRKGPIFSNIILADEINRATPKTQSALLEAMQEGAVTTGGERHVLEPPFFVVATQNPIEMEGTYPLPEAQTDRFFFKIELTRPNPAESAEILNRTTGTEEPEADPVLDGETFLSIQNLVRNVPAAPDLLHYAARIVDATHPDADDAPESVRKYVRHGASPRGAQSLILGAKINALLDGRVNVSFEDVRTVSNASLRHRVLLNFEGEAEELPTDTLIEDVLDAVPEMNEETEALLDMTAPN